MTRLDRLLQGCREPRQRQEILLQKLDRGLTAVVTAFPAARVVEPAAAPVAPELVEA